jgi:aldehyde dehydrogenase
MNHADMQFLDVEFPYARQYANFIGGQWVPPVRGEYFDNVSPITGEPFTSIPRSTEEDIELAKPGPIPRRPCAPLS